MAIRTESLYTPKVVIPLVVVALSGITLLAVGILGNLGFVALPPPGQIALFISGPALLIGTLLVIGKYRCVAPPPNEVTPGGVRYYGKESWEYYVGRIGEVARLPDDIDNILNQECPFSNNTEIKIKDTHVLIWMPANLNREALTADSFIRNMESKNRGHSFGFNYYSTDETRFDLASFNVPQPGWILIKKDPFQLNQEDRREVCTGGRGLPAQRLQAAVLEQEGMGSYTPAFLTEVLACISLVYRSSGETCHSPPINDRVALNSSYAYPDYYSFAHPDEFQYAHVACGNFSNGRVTISSHYVISGASIGAVRRFNQN